MRTIYDYKDLRQLNKSTIYNRLQNGVIITATSDLAEDLRNYYANTVSSKGLTTIDIHRLISSVVTVWDKKVKDIRNYVNLRNIIEDYIKEKELSDEQAAYLRRNAADIWNAIVLLVEADVYPDDIHSDFCKDYPPIQYFKELWKQIEIENPAFMHFRSLFLFKLQDKTYIEKILPDVVKGKELFFLGFYYITPIQARIINLLEHIGYTINFLNRYDKEHAFAFEIWKNTFEYEYTNGLSIDIQPYINTNNFFIRSIEKSSPTSIVNKIAIDSYSTDIEFATACINAKNAGDILFTTDSKITDKLLREFFPEEYDDKHLLSYPVGQYIFYLHMMWNEFIEEPELQFEYVLKCFATGWLEEDGINGKEYLYQLKLLEPYFKNCNVKGTDSFTEWKKRAELLLEAKRTVSTFDEGNDTRWKRLLGNPFNNMAIYQIKETDIEDIIQLLNRLMSDANELFKGDITKNLYIHMQKIKKVIESHADIDTISETEQLVMKELMNRLGGLESNGIVCHLNGIKDAITLLIGNHHEQEESHDDETMQKKRLVKPISLIESCPLIENNQNIYLVMADEFLLPGQPRKLPWPLNDKLVRRLADSLIDIRPDTCSYIRLMDNLIKLRPLANRYLFTVLFDNITEDTVNKIHLSWISKQGEKNVSPSPFISLLGLPTKDIEKKKEENLESKLRNILMDKKHNDAVTNINENLIIEKNLPEEVLGDYALCTMRYTYSYILNVLPAFSSEFHYSFVLANLIGVLAEISGQSKEVIMENISQLFPFMRKIEQQQAFDYAYIKDIKRTLFENIQYPERRLDVHYLQNYIKNLAKKGAMDIFEDNFIKENPTQEICGYCPYNNICKTKFLGVIKDEP